MALFAASYAIGPLWLLLLLIVVVVHGDPHEDCPVRVVSNRVHQAYNAPTRQDDVDASTEEKNSLGSTFYSEVEAVDAALVTPMQGQLAPPPSANNTGILNSEYFSPVEANFRCQYIFLGAANERVQLIFHRFNLYDSDRDSNGTSTNTSVDYTRCEGEDHLTAYVLVGSRLSKIYDFCGNDVPPQLMSTKNLLTLSYVIRSVGKRPRMKLANGEDYGFTLEYRFITDYGAQPAEAIKNPNELCSFTFEGRTQSAGDLWSPNYPGFYPRNAVCSYIFHGSPGQIILISFEYFDVEGFGQCDSSTHSDYVLFSNYRTVDRTNRRYCGSLRPPKSAIASESNFFRMQFSANDIFDGTGFYAHYQFLDTQASQQGRAKLSTSGSGRRRALSIPGLPSYLTANPMLIELILVIALLHCSMIIPLP